jgi:ribosome-associated translation inhibitor RaiA
MSTTSDANDATVAACLQLGHGFHEDEREKVLGILDKLDHRLAGESEDKVRLDLMVKDREGRDQKTTLEVHIAGLPLIVGTSHREDIWAALAEVRDDALRQLDDFKKKHQQHHPH